MAHSITELSRSQPWWELVAECSEMYPESECEAAIELCMQLDEEISVDDALEIITNYRLRN